MGGILCGVFDVKERESDVIWELVLYVILN